MTTALWVVSGAAAGVLIAMICAPGRGSLNAVIRLGGMMAIAAIYCYDADLGMGAGAGALAVETRRWLACRRNRLAAGCRTGSPGLTNRGAA